MAFRALRQAGLALGLGLTAVAAYRGVQNAMADPIAGGRQPLDAGGDREVVFCHQCGNDWYRDEHGLTCPGCQSDAVEIVINLSDYFLKTG